ncbi:MAG: thiamine ABC transporter substrate-binding protein [Phototrophicaceae bacterium]
MRKFLWMLTVLFSTWMANGAAAQSLPFEGVTLRVLAHDSFFFTPDVLARFEAESGMTVEIIRAGDAGLMLNQAILSRENPLADVLFGVDNTLLSRALEAQLFIPYQSPALEAVPDEFELDPTFQVTPIDYGDVALNYDVAWFEANGIPAPTNLDQLLDPQYKSLLVVQDPILSSPGLAFVLTTFANYGTEGDETWLDYWAGLVENDVLVVADWTTAYYTEYSLYGGERPIVVSYATSPIAEVVFASSPLEVAPSGVIASAGATFRQIEFAGILANTSQVSAAQAFIDFLLSEPFQADMPLNMFVFPVRDEVPLPQAFTDFAVPIEASASVPYPEIEASRETWLEQWAEVVLRP